MITHIERIEEARTITLEVELKMVDQSGHVQVMATKVYHNLHASFDFAGIYFTEASFQKLMVTVKVI